jgi:hypothetical protein
LATTKSIDEIKAKDYSLSIPLYVERIDIAEKVESLPIKDVYENWNSSAQTSEKLFGNLVSKLSQGKVL